MKAFKVYFNNGDSLITSMNDDLMEARDYYLGRVFNLGSSDSDILTMAINVEEV